MGGFRDSGVQRNVYFLRFNNKGNLFESSKEPRQGFVPHYSEKDGHLTSYWREHPRGLSGYIDFIKINPKVNDFPESLMIRIKDYESLDDFIITLTTRNQKGGLMPYVKSFIKYYRNIDFTREIVFDSFKRKKDDQYAPGNLIIAYPGAPGQKDILVEQYFKKGVNGLPDPVPYTDIDGTTKHNCIEQDGFLFARLKEYIEEFNNNIKDIRHAIRRKYEERGVNLDQLYIDLAEGNTGSSQKPYNPAPAPITEQGASPYQDGTYAPPTPEDVDGGEAPGYRGYNQQPQGNMQQPAYRQPQYQPQAQPQYQQQPQQPQQPQQQYGGYNQQQVQQQQQYVQQPVQQPLQHQVQQQFQQPQPQPMQQPVQQPMQPQPNVRKAPDLPEYNDDLPF